MSQRLRRVTGDATWQENRTSAWAMAGYRRDISMTFVLDSDPIEDIIRSMLNYSSIIEEIRPPPTDLSRLGKWLRALAEPKRLLILDLIIQGIQCNCELGAAIQMAPNLISHHLKALRRAGLVNVERDAHDARWVYYSVNREALEQLSAAFGALFDPARIRPRRLTCGPDGGFIRLIEHER